MKKRLQIIPFLLLLIIILPNGVCATENVSVPEPDSTPAFETKPENIAEAIPTGTEIPADTETPYAGQGDTQVQSETEGSNDLSAADILNIVVPASLDFTIDPLELAGRGAVYSENFVIENRGWTDAFIMFTDITVTFANDTDFDSLAMPFDGGIGYGRKAIYLLLDFGRDDIAPVVLTDSLRPYAPAFRLNSADSCSLSLSGSVSPYPDTQWETGDVKISITYQFKMIPDMPEEPEATEEPVLSEAAEPSAEPEPSEEPEPPAEPEPSEEPEPTEESALPEEPDEPPAEPMSDLE